jgi:hypothetical protein
MRKGVRAMNGPEPGPAEWYAENGHGRRLYLSSPSTAEDAVQTGRDD